MTTTSVNHQVTDATTQANVSVVGTATANALGSTYQTMAHSTGALFESAVEAQSHQNALSTAANNLGVTELYSYNTLAASGATEKIGQLGSVDSFAGLATLLKKFKEDPGARFV